MGSKFRSNNRPSSSTSYTTIVTTVVFVVICILAVWMLSSSSISSLQNVSSRMATDSPVINGVSNDASKDVGNVYEDNPGDLPEDAIKSDEAKPNTKIANLNKGQDDQSFNGMSVDRDQKQKENEAQVSEESTMTQKQQAEIITASDQEVQNGSDINNGNDQNINNAQDKEQGSESNENQSILESEPQAHAIVKEKIQEQLQEDKGDFSKYTQQSQTQSQSQAQGELAQAAHDEQQPSQQLPSDPTTSSTTTFADETFKKSLPAQSEGTQNMQQDASEDQQQQQNDNSENQEIQHQQVTNAIVESAKSIDESNSGQSVANIEIPKELNESKKSWSTQAAQSKNEKDRRKDEPEKEKEKRDDELDGKDTVTWKLCNVTTGTDYIPCLDNEKAIRKLRSTKHFEHRERHCAEEPPTCLVPPPNGYKRSIKWPSSRDKIWYHNVPHTKLAEFKGHQNWVKVTGEFLTFPGGGTQFIHGALHYIDFLQKTVNDIAWGTRTRVVLDVGCGVASFGGFLFDRDVLTMSFAPKDEHEAQVQFALERGIPAISAVMGSQRLPFPSRVFDIVHCARCRVPWHAEGGKLLLELNRLLRPGGYFVWSATPVYQKLEEDVNIWKEMSKLTASMCWELVAVNKDKLNSVGAAIYRKPTSNECYEKRKKKRPPMCKDNDDANAAWYVPLQACMHRIPVDQTQRGAKWPEFWPLRLQTPPYWLNSSQEGIYGKLAPQDFVADLEQWKNVKNNYMTNMGISWSNVRNIMDMRAVYGGFASALKDQPVWVMNVVNVNSPDTLPIIYERGLFGIYHDWCESFSSYPRSYDLLHADRLFSALKKRCGFAPVLAEVDRLVKPGGMLIVRDESGTIGEVESILKSLHWEVNVTSSKNEEGILSAQKGDWRPETYAVSS